MTLRGGQCTPYRIQGNISSVLACCPCTHCHLDLTENDTCVAITLNMASTHNLYVHVTEPSSSYVPSTKPRSTSYLCTHIRRYTLQYSSSLHLQK